MGGGCQVPGAGKPSLTDHHFRGPPLNGGSVALTDHHFRGASCRDLIKCRDPISALSWNQRLPPTLPPHDFAILTTLPFPRLCQFHDSAISSAPAKNPAFASRIHIFCLFLPFMEMAESRKWQSRGNGRVVEGHQAFQGCICRVESGARALRDHHFRDCILKRLWSSLRDHHFPRARPRSPLHTPPPIVLVRRSQCSSHLSSPEMWALLYSWRVMMH